VGGHRISTVRQGDFSDRGAKAFVNLERVLNTLPHLRVESFAEILFRDADRQRLQWLFQCSAVEWHRLVPTRALAPGGGRHDSQKQGDVGYLTAKRANLIKRTSEGNQSEARYSPVGRLHAHYATMPRGLPNGPSCVTSQCQRRLASRHRSRRASARTAGYVVE